MSDSCSSIVEASRRAALASLGRRSAGAPGKLQAMRGLTEGHRQLREHGRCTYHTSLMDSAQQSTGCLTTDTSPRSLMQRSCETILAMVALQIVSCLRTGRWPEQAPLLWSS